MNREQQIDKEIEALEEERELVRSRKTLACECGKRSQLSKWILISDYHYIRPYGCMGGDYWESSNEYHLICPKCDGVGRVYHASYEDEDSEMNTLYKFVHDHARYFGERLKSYKEGCDVEELRKKARNQV